MLSSACSTYDSIGDANQIDHPDEILVYELISKISCDKSGQRKSLTFKKPVDKSSPLLVSAMLENEKMDAIFEAYTTNEAGVKSLLHRIKLVNATIYGIDLNFPNILTHEDA